MTAPKAERHRVRTLIERAGVAMLMNVNEEGTHIERPMLPRAVSGDRLGWAFGSHVWHPATHDVSQLFERDVAGC